MATCATGQLPLSLSPCPLPGRIGPIPECPSAPLGLDPCKINSINSTGKWKQCPCLLCGHSSLSGAVCHPRGLVRIFDLPTLKFLSTGHTWGQHTSPPSGGPLTLWLNKEGWSETPLSLPGELSIGSVRQFFISLILICKSRHVCNCIWTYSTRHYMIRGTLCVSWQFAIRLKDEKRVPIFFFVASCPFSRIALSLSASLVHQFLSFDSF